MTTRQEATNRIVEIVERKLKSRSLSDEHPGPWDDAEDEYCDDMILAAARELVAAADEADHNNQ